MAKQQIRHPVIFVPGYGGCQLWDGDNDLWLDLSALLKTDSFVERATLQFDPKTRTTHNPDGHNVTVKDFGSTKTVEWLSSDAVWNIKIFGFAPAAYFTHIVDHLVSKGFQRGSFTDGNLKGAPYDWRRAPNELLNFYKNLKLMIKYTYTDNGNTPVVLVAHSMGNLVLLYFLNHVVTQEWKDKYIKAYVALAAPWRGSVEAIRAMISGHKLVGIMGNRMTLALRQVFRAMPSLTFLLPSAAPNSPWDHSEVLVETEDIGIESPTYRKKRKYTVGDYQQLFDDLICPDKKLRWQATKDINSDFRAPGVEIHCIYGIGVDTPGKLRYKEDKFPNEYPKVEDEDGDGTVNRRSLEASKMWTPQNNAGKGVHHIPLPNVEHLDILEDKVVFAQIEQIAMS